MKAKELIDTGATVVLAVAAVAIAISAFGGRGGARLDSQTGSRFNLENWESVAELGIPIGSDTGEFTVVAFMDFTCPFCANLALVLDSLVARFPNEVNVRFNHFVLDGRPGSAEGAKAAECAARQGRFREMMLALYSRETLGTTQMDSLSSASALHDLVAFEACLLLPQDSFPRIADGKSLGRELGVRGTPTVWVNGTLFGGRNVAAFEAHGIEIGVLQ